MEKTLAVINELEAMGLIRKYAIGGAVGLLFHAEPVTTYDLNIFCFIPETARPIVTLEPITQELKSRGYAEDKEHMMVEGTPVQLLPAYNELVAEAVENALEIQFHGVPTRVLRLEHLLAIMVQTGRPKDKARLLDVLDQVQPDATALASILERFHLVERWKEWVTI